MNAQDNLDITGTDRVRFHLAGRSVKLDPRLHAVRRDLADISLAGTLFAPHYAKAQATRCIASGAFLRAKGDAQAKAVSQLLYGETFHVLDITGGWAWGFCGHDGYVGYVERTALSASAMAAQPTHRVSAISAPVFAGASIKAAINDFLPCGALICGTREGDFVASAKGFIHIRHLVAADHAESDWVKAAQQYVGQPYVWGGRGAGGVDCSGLIQVALGQCGRQVPRDSDLQRESIGLPLSDDADLQRGDFLFFPGHVGIMVDRENMLHANAYWMTTLVEPLTDILARLSTSHDQPILARRRITS